MSHFQKKMPWSVFFSVRFNLPGILNDLEKPQVLRFSYNIATLVSCWWISCAKTFSHDPSLIAMANSEGDFLELCCDVRVNHTLNARKERNEIHWRRRYLTPTSNLDLFQIRLFLNKTLSFMGTKQRKQNQEANVVSPNNWGLVMYFVSVATQNINANINQLTGNHGWKQTWREFLICGYFGINFVEQEHFDQISHIRPLGKLTNRKRLKIFTNFAVIKFQRTKAKAVFWT